MLKMFLCIRYINKHHTNINISKNYKTNYLKTPMVLVDAYYPCAYEGVDG